MDKLKQRRKDVRALRAAFAKTAREVKQRLSPAELFEDALDVVDPKRRFLVHVQSAVRRNPLMAVILLMGAVWLMRDGGSEGRSNHRWRKLDKASPATPKIIKGDYHDSESDDRDQWSDFRREEQGAPRP